MMDDETAIGILEKFKENERRENERERSKYKRTETFQRYALLVIILFVISDIIG